MNCIFPDNSPRVLTEPIDVSCIVCNRSLRVRIFPVHCNCEGSDLARFIEHIESKESNEARKGKKIVGLGDVVAKAIDALTFGLLHQQAGCGCDKRKEWLNSLLSWRSTTDDS